MDVRFTVGEFARLCGISRQTLIYYDKENVMKPKYKDESNGYRYYTADQLEQLDCLLILREMGLSLQEIRDYMQHRTLENSLQMLEGQREAIHKKVEELTALERRIEKKTESLQRFCRQDAEFHLEKQPARTLAVLRVSPPGGLLEVDIALKKLMQQVKNSGVEHFYQIGDIVPQASLRAGKYLHFAWVFLPMDSPDDSMETICMPAGEYASQCHLGPYESMGGTYRKMLAEIRRQGKEIAGDSYEFCVLDSLTTSSPEHYCTQIMIPVR